jgi:HrpA-like RNA helicase
LPQKLIRGINDRERLNPPMDIFGGDDDERKPTLMRKGSLRAPEGAREGLQEELDKWTPYEYILQWFRERMSKTGISNRVLILRSETASGKSTLLPPEIYKAFIRPGGPGVICTQPRVLTAIENVNEILENQPSMRRGEHIGWSTGYNKLKPSRTGLLSATVGTLQAQLKSMEDDEIAQLYRFILIDETHERDIPTDISIGLLTGLLERLSERPDCPFVVLMSATFDPQSFLRHFGLGLDNYIWCVGRTFGSAPQWDWNGGRTVANYPRAAVDVVRKIITENPDDPPAAGDILIFLPSLSEFSMVRAGLIEFLRELAAAGKPLFNVLAIDGPAVNDATDDYMNLMYVPVSAQRVVIDGTSYTPRRRVIMSTVVAETGLTLHNLKYVIDSGYNREVEYNPVFGVRALLSKPAPKSRIGQRRGRAGRKFPGFFYPLYPEHIFDALPEMQHPRILVEDTCEAMLDLVANQCRVHGNFLPSRIRLVDPPTPDAMTDALERLYALGFIETGAAGITITDTGTIAARFTKLSPELIRMIFAAYTWDCSPADIASVAAWLSLDTNISESEKKPARWTLIYKRGLPEYTGGVYSKLRLLICDDFIEGIILFNAVAWTLDSGRSIESFCEMMHVQRKPLMKFLALRDEIIEQMLAAKMNLGFGVALTHVPPGGLLDLISRVKHCVYDGFRCNLMVKAADGRYMTLRGLHVIPPKLFKLELTTTDLAWVDELAPSVLVYYSLGLKLNSKTQIYSAIAKKVCSMDGFVAVDLLF